MSENLEPIVMQLAEQLSSIQKQLTQLSDRFDNLENNLGKVSSLPKKISQLEDDLMLLGDRYRYQDLQQYLADENWFEADKETIEVILAVTEKKLKN